MNNKQYKHSKIAQILLMFLNLLHTIEAKTEQQRSGVLKLGFEKGEKHEKPPR
jgi:hypothetical protein